MDVTNTTASATFTLRADATPTQFHSFLSSQPGGSNVTLEFKANIPVVRIVHQGEREVFDERSRTAFTARLRAWNDSLLGQPSASEAANLLNDMLRETALSIDVKDMAPVMSKLSDAYRESQRNIYVRDWLGHEDAVEKILILRDDENGKQERQSLRFACGVLSKFRNPEGAEIDSDALLKEAWEIGNRKEMGKKQVEMLHAAHWRLLVKKADPELQKLIGGEVVQLLALCKDAPGTTFEEYKENKHNRQAIAYAVKALKERSLADGIAPKSPGGTPQPPGQEKHKGHRRTGSGATPLLLSTAPTLSSAGKVDRGEHGLDDSHKSRMPKSPRQRQPAVKTDVKTGKRRKGASPSAAQTMKEKSTGKIRLELRRAQTEQEKDEPRDGSAVSKSQDMPQPYSAQRAADESGGKKGVDLSRTVSPERQRALQRSGTVAASRTEHESNAATGKPSSSPDKGDSTDLSATPKKAAQTPGKAGSHRKHRRHMSGHDGATTATASTASTSASTTASTTSPTLPSSEGKKEKRIPASRKQSRYSQPTHMELNELFKSPKFAKTREDLEKLPMQPGMEQRYAPRSDGKHYQAWDSYASSNTKLIGMQAGGISTAKLLSFYPDLPADPEALMQITIKVLRSAKLNRGEMQDVMADHQALGRDQDAWARNPLLKDVHAILALAVERDNERRKQAKLLPLFDSQ